MTKTVNKFLSVLLAIAMIFSLSVASFAVRTFDLKSGDVAATSGNFKDKYVKELKITVKSGSEFSVTDGFSVSMIGTDGQKRTYDASNASIKVDGKTATIKVSYEANMQHDADYTVTVASGSFKDSDGKLNNEYAFTVNGNVILEHLNTERPTTAIQKLIKWLSSWKYADLIKPIIELLKWFDSL